MKYRSGFEVDIANNLKRNKIKFSYEETVLHYVIEAKYHPDFTFKKKKSNKVMFVEAKGYLKPADRKKMIAVKRANPNIDIRILFQQDNYISKAKTTRYSEWAEKNGFPWAIGVSLPDKWLKEIK